MCAVVQFLPQQQPQDWLRQLPQEVGWVLVWAVLTLSGGASVGRVGPEHLVVLQRFLFSFGLNLHVHSWSQTSIVEQEYCYSSSFTLYIDTITSSSRDFELLLKSSLIHPLYIIERNIVLMIYNTKPYKIPKNIALQHVKHCQRFFSMPAPLP